MKRLVHPIINAVLLIQAFCICNLADGAHDAFDVMCKSYNSLKKTSVFNQYKERFNALGQDLLNAADIDAPDLELCYNIIAEIYSLFGEGQAHCIESFVSPEYGKDDFDEMQCAHAYEKGCWFQCQSHCQDLKASFYHRNLDLKNQEELGPEENIFRPSATGGLFLTDKETAEQTKRMLLRRENEFWQEGLSEIQTLTDSSENNLLDSAIAVGKLLTFEIESESDFSQSSPTEESIEQNAKTKAKVSDLLARMKEKKSIRK